jgi:acyl-CoA synthetase (NDP forming)/GNAT superfamily N-acetyltransferase
MEDDRDEWSVAIVLSDGDTAFIRPITAADAPSLLEFHERQPREDLYLRFFSAKPSLSPTELEHFTVVDFRDRVALVMEYHGDFIAWASYERWPGRDDAEVAFMVDHHHRGRGIATLLLEHLAAIARSNGISRFTAEVLYENKSMLRVFTRAGWPVKRRYDSGVTELEFALGDTQQFIGSVEDREHRADSSAVARLLLPRTIAVIGASDRTGTVGHELWRNASTGFDGPVYPVNARHESVGGQRAYASVGDIDDDIWLAIVAVPASVLAAVVETCIAKRVRGAVIVTSVDGEDVDVDALVEHARRNGLRIIGPASMGFASPRGTGGIQAALIHVGLPADGIAISMQSGSLGASLLQQADELSMGISWFVSLGDKADVSGNDLLQFWEDDESTRVIAIYTETFGNPRKFARIARRVGRKRPIVAVRTGAAALGNATDAVYQQAGLIEVPTVRAMLDTVRVLASQPIPKGPRVAVLTNARSPGVLAGAALAAAGLDVVEPPVRLDWRSSDADFGFAVAAAVADEAVDAVFVIHAPPFATTDAPMTEIDVASAGSGTPVIAVMLGRRDGPIQPGSRVPAFSFPESAAAVLGRMCAYSRWLSTEADGTSEPATGTDGVAAAVLLDRAMDLGGAVLDLDDTAALLGSYGLALPAASLVDGADAPAVLAAAAAIGYPVALKATHRRVGRSAQAGVALDLSGPAAVAQALAVIRASLGGDAAALVVQQMVEPGIDVRIHCSTDDSIGPVVTLELGSQQFTSGEHSASRLAPLSVAGAESLVRTSQVGAALAASGLGTELLIDVLRRISELMADHAAIADITVNPAIVSSSGCFLTDARITVHPAAPNRPMRRLG